MCPNDGGVKHLDQVGRLARGGECVEKGLEHASPAQAPKALPDRVPVAELGRECSPCDVVDAEVVQRLQEPTVVSTFVAPARAHSPKHLNPPPPVLIRHPRQHGRFLKSNQPGSRNPQRRESAQKSARPNPSTRPRLDGSICIRCLCVTPP